MIDVTAAILTQAGRVLIARRKAGASRAGMWEFPGGKVRPGESPEECLTREIREELGLEIAVGKFFGASVHAYADRSIRLLAYWARIEAGALVLNDHAEVKWVRCDELGRFTFCAADLPFVRRLTAGVECQA
jgi:8-oxo-dGTP diphosphatase